MTKLPEVPQVLTNMLSDIASQPRWRGEAAVDMAWKDNRQWSKEQIAYIVSLGLNPIHCNLIAPAMDSVTGYEAKHRVDWMLIGASEEHEEMAEGVNHELNDAMRMADANHACSEAYASQAGVGIGWCEVRKNNDPLDPRKINVNDIHRNEMFWDMRARSEDLRSDCRWIARRKFYDKDAATIFLGDKHKDLIDFTFSDYQTVDITPESMQYDWFNTMTEYTDPIELVMEDMSDRKMVAIYQVYFKVFEKRDLLVTPIGVNYEFNPNNPVHIEMLSNGDGQIVKNIPINVCKVAWYVGPHLIYVGPSAEPHNHFPFVPFFGEKEDGNNCPQGLIRRMRGPQEQYNRAIVEIQRILRSRRIEKDHDALHEMTDTQALFEVNRTEGIINLKRNSKFEVIREWEKLAALEGICKRSREEVNAASGIYQTFQGQTETAQSGVAVDNIAELGTQSLGKVNSNYQLARKLVGDLAFSHIVDSIGTHKKIISIPQEIGQTKKEVSLNDGVSNRVAMLRAQVAMQDIQTSAGYKQHTYNRLVSVYDKTPDEFKGALLPLLIEASDTPKKAQVLKILNQQLGIIQDEDQRAIKEQTDAEEARERKAIEFRMLNAEVLNKEADTKNKNASANKSTADAIKARTETAQLIKNLKLNGSGQTPSRPMQLVSPKTSTPVDPRGKKPLAASSATKKSVGSADAKPRAGTSL